MSPTTDSASASSSFSTAYVAAAVVGFVAIVAVAVVLLRVRQRNTRRNTQGEQLASPKSLSIVQDGEGSSSMPLDTLMPLNANESGLEQAGERASDHEQGARGETMASDLATSPSSPHTGTDDHDTMV